MQFYANEFDDTMLLWNDKSVSFYLVTSYFQVFCFVIFPLIQ